MSKYTIEFEHTEGFFLTEKKKATYEIEASSEYDAREKAIKDLSEKYHDVKILSVKSVYQIMKEENQKKYDAWYSSLSPTEKAREDVRKHEETRRNRKMSVIVGIIVFIIILSVIIGVSVGISNDKKIYNNDKLVLDYVSSTLSVTAEKYDNYIIVQNGQLIIHENYTFRKSGVNNEVNKTEEFSYSGNKYDKISVKKAKISGEWTGGDNYLIYRITMGSDYIEFKYRRLKK